ncbi:SixA phosphatase family protein [Nitrospira sp. NS4]|uniref:SixA phosphatase family protein n=1 Tax=Nitrospira sp. NS4 TaxID=3414498 RepID=UPI003C2F42CB
MDCILMRHGIAIDGEAWDGPDETRPLTGQGKKKLREAARGLAAMGLSPTHILSSPLTRARETARLVRESIGSSPDIVECKELAPGTSPEQLTALLSGLPSDALVLCVGHEPLLGETAGYWLTGRSRKNFPLKKAGALHVRFDQTVAAGQGILRWCCQPAQLRLIGERHPDAR